MRQFVYSSVESSPTDRKFVASCNWTGAGELEFVETVESSLHNDNEGSFSWYIIDFNTRFPAWIGACIYTNLNLPADLICHFLAKRSISRKKEKNACSFKWSYSHYLNVVDTDYTRSVIEMPVMNVNNGRKCIYHTISQARLAKGSIEGTSTPQFECHLSDSTAVKISVGMESSSASSVESGSDALSDVSKSDKMLCIAASAAVVELNSNGIGGSKRTPFYVLSEPSFSTALIAHRDIIKSSIDRAGMMSGYLKSTENLLDVVLKMSISVKTQPCRDILIAARSEGYMAECISMAEVRLALNCGYNASEILLTGPGKFWDAPDCNRLEATNYSQLLKNAPLAAVFADSVSELVSIVTRLLDPDDWLRSDVIGVRLQPIGNHSLSRFGIDMSNPSIFRAVSAIIRLKVPTSTKLGIHLHFAASAPATGLEAWYGMAKAAAALAGDFARSCGRPLSILDFGGGFPSNFIEHSHTSSDLTSLFEFTRQQCNFETVNGPQYANKLTIQFELGKCISERSGGLICRVLGIREVVANEMKGDGEISWNDSDLTVGNINFLISRPCAGLSVTKYAIIVDACVGDISDYSHCHTLFWKKSDDGFDWVPLAPGHDEVWGRTCMEFDLLVGNTGGWGFGAGACGTGRGGIELPDGIKIGDFILIGSCGAYDMR